jgi:hypothetical protein
MEPRMWTWSTYYWNFLKHLGQETYRTWRWELFASVPIGMFTAALTGGWKDFRTALVATGLTLGCFIVWHSIRMPWLIHKSTHGGTEPEPGTWYGVFGVLVVVGIFIGGYEFSMQIWNSRPLGDITTSIPSADPGAKNTEIVQLKQQIDACRKQRIVTGQIKSAIPLQCRAKSLSRQLHSFSTEWRQATCTLYGGADMNHQQEILQNERKIASNDFKRDYLGDVES